jgi:hypothetical protein
LRRDDGELTGPLQALEGTLNLALILSGLLLLGITGYYIYGTVAAGDQIFRAMGPNGQAMSPQDYQRHLANMELLTKVLMLAGVVLVVSAVARYYPYPETGLALLAAGGLLFFGMPYLIDNYGGAVTKLPAALARLDIPDPRSYLKSRFGLVGMGFGGAGVIVLLLHAVALIAGGRKRRPRVNEEAARTAAQVRKPNDRFLGPCWSLPFCRDTEKQLCPIRHSKKPCWRKGRGCYCDQNVILTLSGGNQYAASRGSTGYLSSAAATMARPKSLSEKRAQCLQCPVYLHHQSHKYKVLAPGSLLLIVGLLGYYWNTLMAMYPEAIRAMGRSVSVFSFGAKAGTVPAWANDMAANSAIMWLVIAVVVMGLVSYLLHGVEWALYKLGI